jgi:hypothetical protein
MVLREGCTFVCDDLLDLFLFVTFVGFVVVGEAIADVFDCLRAGKAAIHEQLLRSLLFVALVAGELWANIGIIQI